MLALVKISGHAPKVPAVRRVDYGVNPPIVSRTFAAISDGRRPRRWSPRPPRFDCSTAAGALTPAPRHRFTSVGRSAGRTHLWRPHFRPLPLCADFFGPLPLLLPTWPQALECPLPSFGTPPGLATAAATGNESASAEPVANTAIFRIIRVFIVHLPRIFEVSDLFSQGVSACHPSRFSEGGAGLYGCTISALRRACACTS